jgi:hypothetical protein
MGRIFTLEPDARTLHGRVASGRDPLPPAPHLAGYAWPCTLCLAVHRDRPGDRGATADEFERPAPAARRSRRPCWVRCSRVGSATAASRALPAHGVRLGLNADVDDDQLRRALLDVVALLAAGPLPGGLG